MEQTNDLTLNQYQEEARKTAIYPRLFTESQIRSMIGYISADIEELHSVSVFRILDALEGAMDAIETPFNRLVYPVLGLVGEAGELANKIKKFARDTSGQVTPDDLVKLADEQGDTLWYQANIADGIGISLGEVGSANLSKLADRAQRGVIKGSGDNR